MAIAIKSIPVLTNKVAQSFIKIANENKLKKSSIDFSKQSENFAKIMAKAKI